VDYSNLEAWHFELSEQPCNHLLGLALQGKKRATSGSMLGYQMEDGGIPEPGSMSVITDWDGNPRCVVRTTKVSVLPFRSITYEMAVLEGEDASLDSWRKSHERFFREEGKALGYSFSEDMDVVFEEFEVVETIGENPSPMA